MELELDFNKEEEKFFYENKKILNNMFNRVALVSCRDFLGHFEKFIPKEIYKNTIFKINQEIKRL